MNTVYCCYIVLVLIKLIKESSSVVRAWNCVCVLLQVESIIWMGCSGPVLKDLVLCWNYKQHRLRLMVNHPDVICIKSIDCWRKQSISHLPWKSITLKTTTSSIAESNSRGFTAIKKQHHRALLWRRAAGQSAWANDDGGVASYESLCVFTSTAAGNSAAVWTQGWIKQTEPRSWCTVYSLELYTFHDAWI